MTYDDVFNSDDSEAKKKESKFRVNRWNIGGEHPSDQEPVDEEDVKFFDKVMSRLGFGPGMDDLVEEARNRANDMEVVKFQCNVCGIPHPHEDYKHDIRKDLNKAGLLVTDDFAERMGTTAYCHCAPHELKMILEYWEDINRQVFKDQYYENFSIKERKKSVDKAAGAARVGDNVHRIVDDLRNEIEETLK